MDALRGTHAMATVLISLFVMWVSYTMLENFFDATYTSISPFLGSVYWVSYIIILFVLGVLIVPALIAFSEDGDASIISLLMAFGSYFIGIFIMRILHPLITVFTGTSTTTGILADYTLSVQVMSFLWLVAVFIVLFLIPAIIALAPNFIIEQVKQ